MYSGWDFKIEPSFFTGLAMAVQMRVIGAAFWT